MKAPFIVLSLICLLFSCQEGKQLKLDSLKDTYALFTYSDQRIPMISAHRGGPYAGYPENSLEAFAHVVQHHVAIIECDVAVTRDDSLMMMHDNTLNRTTTGKGNILDKTYEEVKAVQLKNLSGKTTAFKVPSFSEVLAWTKGRSVLMVDVKQGVPWERIVEKIRAHQVAPYCVLISYTVEQAKEIYALAPDMMLSVTIRNQAEYERLHEAGIPDNRMVAFTGISESSAAHYQFLHDKGIMTILGTMGNLDQKAETKGDQLFYRLVENGADILSTDRPIEAQEAIKPLISVESPVYQRFFIR